ncbi:bifunctional [glutamine synthetase] adenylyltransferase/[glutamine synthetase]-adenylyl-L-tyrosine phosphorylase [Acidisoma cellulosilytica]|uniref:Bifunctional [glutamine synthetase] adenylyltransferase/[glutamine synthetase]-adenylyl-L-tyrosine phosphorylase n=1 Tax=Acidisoma cellulosilyticum TaxID=2802395 RepID=A0A964E5T1_9PROT|nr:bifunctional [glutamine synthetase] adenylyltransferase/[glutamine synthetase]-adenylyl-L-tyrosine phosphorylase [Acidisoma cellulosilyticum]MCB8882841.1 bifunctional [glutamine synthetase] adenylyltransferase/[glutamine synthetase]-adenylyl-L-tyrosine phosphorylase [Acidisoma cellulosilyticum]
MTTETPFHWPEPADLASADRFVERFQALAGMEAVPLAMLRAIGGNSEYLAGLSLRESATLLAVWTEGPEAAIALAFARLGKVRPDITTAALGAAMRDAKRQVALAVALGDIGGVLPLSRVTGALSRLAEETLQLAVRHLLLHNHAKRRIRLPDPSGDPVTGSGLTVLALGKLGGRELNYSSDIDLIVFYDPAAIASPQETIGESYTRLARDLVKLMEARDGGGYVFRVDLRLRPDPSAMPLAISVPTALAYYETMGRNWERAAFIKARPVAGDIALGLAFLDHLRPFIWRRHLDFAAIADIHAMKRLMDAHRGGPIPEGQVNVQRLLSHNLKIGRGGIREIEFLAQSQQLVWGGREPMLRVGATLPALRLLTRLRHVSSDTAGVLTRAYRFLRQIEHRLQMIADRQTHSLPDTAEGMATLATFMGFPSAQAFADGVLTHLSAVQALYDSFFEMAEDAESLTVGHAGSKAPEQTIARLTELGFADTPRIVETIRRWLSGRPRALRSERARSLLEPLLPPILRAIAAQPQPDQTFARFDHFVSGLPAGVQLFSLFSRNPALIDRIAVLLGAAPGLADHLVNHPGSLEGLLGSEEARSDPSRALRAQLVDASTFEDRIGLTRHFVSEEHFRIGVATLEGRMDVDAAGIARTALADAALATILDAVVTQQILRYGALRGATWAVLLLGKGGSQEMMPGSDLDLMFIYDRKDDVEVSDGPRPLASSQWVARLVTALTGALTAQGVEGPLYKVDMRLRPSGNQGPVAVSLAAFRKYHAEQAWTWEQMALTRARAVTGAPAFLPVVEDALREALRPRRAPEVLRRDALDMRRRMLRDLPPAGPWDVKLIPGGAMEVEFIAQVLQLTHGAQHPELRSTVTRVALGNLVAAGLIPQAEGRAIIAADHLWRTIQSMLRLTVGLTAAPELPEASGRILLAATRDATMPELRSRMEKTAALVRAAFIRHIGDPALPDTTPKS